MVFDPPGTHPMGPKPEQMKTESKRVISQMFSLLATACYYLLLLLATTRCYYYLLLLALRLLATTCYYLVLLATTCDYL